MVVPGSRNGGGWMAAASRCFSTATYLSSPWRLGAERYIIYIADASGTCWHKEVPDTKNCKKTIIVSLQVSKWNLLTYVDMYIKITICIRTLGYLDYTLSEVTGSIYNIRPPLRTNMSLTIDGWKMLEDEMSFHHNSFIGDMRSFSGGQNFRWKKFETTTWDV